MAVVADLARPGEPLDRPQTKPNRKAAGSPITLALTPSYAGEIVLNTDTGELWLALGTASNDWVPAVLGV
jgi:hypothetical protein